MDQWEYLRVLKNCALCRFDELYGGTNNYHFLQDNFKGHTSYVVNGYLKAKKINLIDFPPCSPDINVIENFWSLLQKNVDK